MKSFKLLTLIFLVSVMALTGCNAKGSVTATPSATATPTVTAGPTPSAVPTATAAVEATATPIADGNAVEGTLVLTLDELSTYNGENGNPAYIAVDGFIYDVTNVPQWKNGKHKGYTAGKDLTSEIKKSPHGSSVLKGIPVVGKIAP